MASGKRFRFDAEEGTRGNEQESPKVLPGVRTRLFLKGPSNSGYSGVTGRPTVVETGETVELHLTGATFEVAVTTRRKHSLRACRKQIVRRRRPARGPALRRLAQDPSAGAVLPWGPPPSPHPPAFSKGPFLEASIRGKQRLG